MSEFSKRRQAINDAWLSASGTASQISEAIDRNEEVIRCCTDPEDQARRDKACAASGRLRVLHAEVSSVERQLRLLGEYA